MRDASSISSICFDDRYLGICTFNFTNRSPFVLGFFRCGIPRPASRKTWSGCVPAGIPNFTLPAGVSTSASPPRIKVKTSYMWMSWSSCFHHARSDSSSSTWITDKDRFLPDPRLPPGPWSLSSPRQGCGPVSLRAIRFVTDACTFVSFLKTDG
jgi:hypothetical protein